ncbi:MAG: hypothetical protein AB7P03_03295 [Kofleriaceae bacterium]
MRTLALAVCSFAVIAVGCGGGGSDLDLDNRDPRCVTACTDDPPDVEGSGDVCNTQSQAVCLDDCEARIADTSTVCANCLLEDAYFGPGDGDGFASTSCNAQNECTITNGKDSCMYTSNDQQELEDCLRQLFPRREVACDVDYRPTTECASVCN